MVIQPLFPFPDPEKFSMIYPLSICSTGCRLNCGLSGSVTHPLDNYWTYTSQHLSPLNLHQPKCVNSPKIISLSEGVIEMSSAPLKKAVP